ncbi:MAG: hemerythrin domain-containing protein [Geminicoccaceae bacterium]
MPAKPTKDPLALDLRTGLPDALRVLLEDYPRAGWPDEPGYAGLVQFWLDRHMMFRRILDRLRAEAALCADHKLDPDAYRAALSRHGSAFVSELHGHHRIEDVHYFPTLMTKEARIATGFDLLDRDHQALDGHLEAFVQAANATLGAPQASAAAFHDHLRALERVLDRHLIDEEELVVPVILKYGASGLV